MPSFPYASQPHRRTRAALVLPSAVLAVAAVAGCGSGGANVGASTASATSASATGAPAAGASGAPNRANGFAAYAACLAKAGVTLPTGRPGGAAGPSGAVPSRIPGGGFGGGFGGLNTADPKVAAAVKSCASLRPTGGFGGANSSAIASQLTAYRGCLSDHGVTLPSVAPRPTGTAGAPGRPAGGFGGIGALNTADPKVAAAVKACAPLRPTFGAGAPGAGGVAVPTGTPSA